MAADDLAHGLLLHSVLRHGAMADIKGERDFWENRVLRKTTLGPGYQAEGLVLFPRNATYSKISIRLPLEELNFSFDYSLRR